MRLMIVLSDNTASNMILERAITVDNMPAIDYSPDNAGSLLIAVLAQLLVDGLANR